MHMGVGASNHQKDDAKQRYAQCNQTIHGAHASGFSLQRLANPLSKRVDHCRTEHTRSCFFVGVLWHLAPYGMRAAVQQPSATVVAAYLLLHRREPLVT